MGGDVRLFVYGLLARSMVRRKDIVNEYKLAELPYTIDLAILPDQKIAKEIDYKSLDWPYKGILIEFDGPHHYYAPFKGQLQMTSFSRNSIKLIKHIGGFKVFTIPFYDDQSKNIFDQEESAEDNQNY